jgi:hypothetical protein
MKSNILYGVAFMLMSLNNLLAQDSIQVSAAVSSSFASSFNGASKVKWQKLSKGISQVQFGYMGNSWIAYFEQNGNLLTSGRRIKSFVNLPLKVQTGLEKKKAHVEKKFGPFTVASMYEMVRGELTSYIITMTNDRALITCSVNSSGLAIVERKLRRTIDPQGPKDVIAKKY